MKDKVATTDMLTIITTTATTAIIIKKPVSMLSCIVTVQAS
jgi:hypothetical protein